jgi:hypothetical protein
MMRSARLASVLVLAGCVPIGPSRTTVNTAGPGVQAQGGGGGGGAPDAPRVVSEATGSHVVTGYNTAERELIKSEGIDEDAPWHALAARAVVADTKQFVVDARRNGTWAEGLRYQTENDGTFSEQEMLQRLDDLATKVDAAWTRAQPVAHKAWKKKYGATSSDAIAKLEELGKPVRVTHAKKNTCWYFERDDGNQEWCWTAAGKLATHHIEQPVQTAVVEEPSDGGGGAGASGGSAPPPARSGSYKKVSIFNGQPSCGGSWAQEKAVILDSDGYYKECDIFNGQCNSPGSWYQGKAVIKDTDGYYKECDIFNGKCNSPGSWYQGDAVVWCED